MITLNSLENTSRPKKKIQRVGRGVGSGRGKTSCRGVKGAGSRSGYKRRLGKEGGQVPLFRKLPCRGFTNGRFRIEYEVINLRTLNELFKEGETVSRETLAERGYGLNRRVGIKVLGEGDLTKKLTINVDAISTAARTKLDKNLSQ